MLRESPASYLVGDYGGGGFREAMSEEHGATTEARHLAGEAPSRKAFPETRRPERETGGRRVFRAAKPTEYGVFARAGGRPYARGVRRYVFPESAPAQDYELLRKEGKRFRTLD